MTQKKIGLLLLVLAFLYVFFAFDLGQYLNLEYLKSRQVELEAYLQAHQARAYAGSFIDHSVLARPHA